MIAYAVAITTGWYTLQEVDHLEPVWAALIADVVATVVIFAFSRVFNNSSIYDPYWSVIPPIIVLYFAQQGMGLDSLTSGIPLIGFLLVSAWGIRLTYNFFRGWKGIEQQDWRYDDLQTEHGKLYWFVSFAGIHMFPTLLVFGGCLSFLATFYEPDTTSTIAFLQYFGIAWTTMAIIVETLADEQLRAFVKSGPPSGTTMKTGLWKYSRHPNYFGEISFWWGMYFIGLGSNPAYWWTIVGPLAITLLFVFISLPMIDKRMQGRRHDYMEYRSKTSAIIPLPSKS